MESKEIFFLVTVESTQSEAWTWVGVEEVMFNLRLDPVNFLSLPLN